MIVEILSVTVLLGGGCLIARAIGWNGWSVPAFGLVAGICVYLTVGFVQVVTPLPTSPVVTLALTTGVSGGWWLVRWRQGYAGALPARYVAVGLAMIAVAVPLLRLTNLVKWHTDSLKYATTSWLLATGQYYDAMPTRETITRPIGLPLLHTPAQLAGEYYLRSITALLAAATVALLVWFFRQGAERRLDPAQLTIFAALAALLLATTNRFVFNAFYLNGHLLTATLLLVIAGCGWLLANDHPAARGLMNLQLLALAPLVVTRPEGPLLAGLAILPSVLSARVPVRHRSAVLVVLGVSTVAWESFVLWTHQQRAVEVPLSVLGTLVAGVILVGAGAGFRWLAPVLRHPARLRWSVEIALWVVLAVFVVRQPGIMADSVTATIQNLVLGAGKWGTTWIILAALLVGAMLYARDRGLAELRFPLTTFVPLAFLLAYVRDEGAYRVGYGDSLSRMLIHILPLAVLYLTTAYTSAETSTRGTRLLSAISGHRGQGRPRSSP